MFDGLDPFKYLLQSGDPFFQKLTGLLSQGPKVNVYEEGDCVKVIIEAQGLMKAKNPHQWAVRVQDQNLFLRAQLELVQSARDDISQFYSQRRSEQFTKIIPLPAPVQRKPRLVQYKDGLITIVLEREKGPVDEEWHALDFRKRNENKS